MNSNIFRLVFNKKTGQLVPVAETTTSNGKGSAGNSASGVGGSPQSASGKGLLTWSLLTAAAAAAYLTIPIMGGSAFAADVLPTQGQVINGNATVNVNGRVMTVQQLSSVLGVNWQSFNIGAGNTVVFQQPNAASVAINRVIGNNRSEIYGNLRANGQVFLLNQNGVLFGKGSEISVGGLVASTAADATRNAKGQWQLTGGGSNSVINQGNIKATDGGYVVLAGAQSNNEGSITANQGTVALAAGGNVTLTLDNASLLGVKVDEATLNALAQNKGLIQADGGAVYLTAAGRNTLLNTVVNNEGLIQARALGVKDGQVVLMAEGGDAVTAGAIDVSGQNTGEKGGAVAIGGNRVGVFGNASIDASGVAGGGRVVIGGDSLGKATDVASIGFADNTVVDGAATIKVGSSQGDGGFVETSGKKLSMLGRIDGQAAGKNGEWLIDPTDITIGSVTTANATQVTGNWTVTGDTATVNLSSVTTALNAGTNVSITTNSSGAGNGDITLNGNIVKSTGARSSLTLTANRSVALNGNIVDTSSGPLDVTINATQSTQGNVTLANYITIGTNGTTAINVPRGFVVTGMNADTLNAGTGSITINATTNVSNQSAISGGVLNTYGNVTLVGTSTATTGNATGIALYGISVLGTGGGTTKLVGTGSGYGAGVQVNTDTTAVSGDVLNITGRGDVYTGVNIFGNVTGNVNYAGTSYYSRSFLLNTGTKLDATNNGTMSGNITFASNVVGRTVFAGNVSVTGNVAIQNYGYGTNGGNSKGVDFSNANVTVSNGTLSLIAANSYSDGRASTGIDLTNAKLTVGSDANLLVVQAISKSATSSNASSAGILMNGTTVTGNLTVSQAQDIVMNGTNTLNANGGVQYIRSSNGTLSVSGTTNTNGFVVLSDTTGLNITGSINVTGGTTTLSSNASSMGVGNITGAGKLALGEGVSTGNITQTAGSTINMTGVTAINAGTSNVTLSNSGNSFAGGLSASAVGNLSIASNTSVALANISTSGGLTVNTSAANANITQAAGSNLTVAGATSLSAGTGNVTLTNSNNLLTGQVSVSNATAVTVVNNMAMNVGAASSTGDLALSTKSGDLTLNGNMVSTGGNVTVSAGTASAVASTAVTNGNVTGGDVIKGTATSISAGTGKTVTMYSGNANTASLATLVANGTTSQNKAYATAAGAGASNASRALNVFYRVSPTLTISGATAQNKVYDGTTAAVVNGTVAGGIDGDTVSTSVIGTFANKTVGTGKSIALALVSAPTASANLSVGNYTISAPPALTANITTATLAVTGLTASDKAYDGNTNATLGGTAAVSGFASDAVSVSGTSSGTFSDKNVGANKTVTISGLTLTGADASNYVIGQPASLTANITAAAVTITAGNQTKTYDGTTNVSNTSAYTTTGVVAGESITASLAYTDKNAGAANKTIAVSGATAGANTSLSNYNVSYTNNTVSTIDKANITGIAGVTLSNKVYDGTTNASFNASAATFTGKVAGDTLTLTGGTGGFASKNVGNNINVSVSNMTLGGADAGNYNVTGGTPSFNGTANITAAAVTITANTQSKTYDGTTIVSNTSAYTTTGVVAGESITASLAYTDKNAGAANKTITVSGATAGANTSLSNYNVSYTNNTISTINKADLTAAVNNDAKFVTQTDNASYAGISYSGFVGGDTSGTAVTGGTVSRTNTGTETAGTYNGVLTASNITAANYNIIVQAGNFTIVPADQLLVRVTNTNSTYGSAANLTVSSAQYMNSTNVISNLTLSSQSGNTYSYSDGVGGQATFTLSPLNSTVSTSGNTVVGAYQLGATNVTTQNAVNFNSNLTVVGALTVDKANISSVSGISAANKVYDGTTNATLDTSSAVFNGKVSGDSLSVSSASGAFVDPTVGTAKIVNISGVTLGGTDVANYVLLSPTATTTANITAVTIIPPTTDTATTTDTGYLVSTTATKLGLVGNSSLTDVLRLSPQNETHKKGTSSLVAINRGGISLPAYIPLYSDEADKTKESN